jgi:hypothetical protein
VRDMKSALDQVLLTHTGTDPKHRTIWHVH